MESLTPESRNMVNLRQSDFMNDNECSGICLFKVIMSKSQVGCKSTINLLRGKLTTGMIDKMATSGNSIAIFNKYVLSIVTAFHACGEDPGNLLPQISVTYSDFSSDNGPFTRYIEILENSTAMEK